MKRQGLSRRSLLVGVAATSFGCPASAQRTTTAPGPTPIEVQATRLSAFSRTTSAKRFGRLEFRGGLTLRSDSKDFGGWSGLAVEPDGRRFLAVSDEGSWMSGDILYEGTAPVGLGRTRMAGIPGLAGRPLLRKRDKDAEGIALISGSLSQGEVLIAFERNHRIARHQIANGVLQPPVGLLRLPPEARRMSSNKSLEAITVLAGGPAKGAVVAISERYPDAGGDHVGWIWSQGEPRRFGFKDLGGFDVTAAAGLADGSLLVLERRFKWTEGVKIQLRRFSAREIAPGVTGSTGELLLNADMSYEIDNMEALAVHRGPSGEQVLTMLSDDNFNRFLQRTVLLQFTLT